MSPDRSARIAFYSHDTLGLGHMRRCLKIAEAMEDTIPGASGVMLSGSPWSGMLAMPAAFRLVSLEPVRKLGPGLYSPRAGSLDIAGVLMERGRRLQEELLGLAPDLLVVDNVPCGLKGELLPALHRLRRNGCRVALSLRDVLDDDASIRAEWCATGALDALARLYDEIWLFGEAESQSFRFLPDWARARTVLCGHLGGARGDVRGSAGVLATGEPGTARRHPRILVTGGGGSDAGALVTTYLSALRLLRPVASHHIVLGPDFPESQLQALGDLEEVAALGATVVRFEHDMRRAMADADVVVAMAGYNTVYESLAAGRRLVLVPRLWPRHEQSLRAEALARSGRAEVLLPDVLTPEVLWKAIQRTLEGPEPRPACFDGARRAASRGAALVADLDLRAAASR